MELRIAKQTVAIGYYRVSTNEQKISGLGLEAQRKSVQDFATIHNYVLQEGYIEIESGAKNDRPMLRRALQHCRRTKAVLLIAKLDRLGRNVTFIAQLMESDISFIAVDQPFAQKVILHILAAFSEYERDQIRQRTKVALQAAKSRGVRLGKYGADVLSKQNREAADRFAIGMQPVIRSLNAEGFITVRQLTDVMNSRKIAPFKGRGGRWHISSVHMLLKRIERLNKH